MYKVFKVFKNPRVMIICAVVCGLAAAYWFIGTYNQIMKTKHVLVAKGDIKQETETVLGSNVVFGDKPNGGLPDDAITDEKDIYGKATKGFIPKDTVIRKAMLTEFKGVSIQGQLKNMPGLLGVSFEQDIYTTVGNQLTPGSIVTITAILKPQGGSGNGITDEIGKDIKILSVDPDGKKGIVAALTSEQYQKVAGDNAAGAKYQFALQPRS